MISETKNSLVEDKTAKITNTQVDNIESINQNKQQVEDVALVVSNDEQEKVNKFNTYISQFAEESLSNKDIADIYNNHQENRKIIIGSIGDNELKSSLEKFFKILDTKAVGEDHQKKITEDQVKSLEPGKIEYLKDTLKAIANLIVQVCTVGFKSGFDRSEYQDKSNLEKIKKAGAKSLKERAIKDPSNQTGLAK